VTHDREDYERRVASSQQILEQAKKQSEENARMLSRNEEEVAERLVRNERERRKEIFERSCSEMEKSEEVRRLARSRANKAQMDLARKVERAEGRQLDLRAEMTSSVVRKERVQVNFMKRRSQVLKIPKTLENLPEREMIQELKDMLGIDDAEASAIVRSAKASRHATET